MLAFFIVVDFPDKNKFLSRDETAFIIDRVNKDRGDGEADPLTFKKAMHHLADIRTWCFGLCFMCSTLPSYAFAYFLPIILEGQGYSVLLSLMLSAPPYLFAAIYTFGIAYCSDRFKQRGLFVSINAIVCLTGCVIIGFAKNKDVRYFGSFLSIAGAQCNVPSVLAYGTNNTVTYSKKAVASAIIIGMGGVGGIFASTVFRQVDYPRYLPGLGATIGAQIFILCVVAALTVHFTVENRKLDRGEREPVNGVESFRWSI